MPRLRADGLARLATLIRAAPLMGMPLVTLCTGTRNPTDQWAHHPDNAGPAAWHDLMRGDGQGRFAGRGMRRRPRHRAGTGERRVVAPRLARRLIDKHRLAAHQDRARSGKSVRDGDRRPKPARSSPTPSTCSATASSWRMPRIGAPTAAFAAAGSGVIDFGISCDSLRDAGFDGPLVDAWAGRGGGAGGCRLPAAGGRRGSGAVSWFDAAARRRSPAGPRRRRRLAGRLPARARRRRGAGGRDISRRRPAFAA